MGKVNRTSVEARKEALVLFGLYLSCGRLFSRSRARRSHRGRAGGSRTSGRSLRRQSLRRFVVIHCPLEGLDSFSHSAHDFGDPLGSEEQDDDEQNYNEFLHSKHGRSIPPLWCTWPRTGKHAQGKPDGCRCAPAHVGLPKSDGSLRHRRAAKRYLYANSAGPVPVSDKVYETFHFFASVL
jgi:hypothetical protein